MKDLGLITQICPSRWPPFSLFWPKCRGKVRRFVTKKPLKITIWHQKLLRFHWIDPTGPLFLSENSKIFSFLAKNPEYHPKMRAEHAKEPSDASKILSFREMVTFWCHIFTKVTTLSYQNHKRSPSSWTKSLNHPQIVAPSMQIRIRWPIIWRIQPINPQI